MALFLQGFSTQALYNESNYTKKNEASFRLLVSKIYFLRDQAIQTCKEKNLGCNETCRPTINRQTWAKIVKKEK